MTNGYLPFGQVPIILSHILSPPLTRAAPMSTRATYQIDGHTFYIHHDGYLEGGAFYFGRAVLFVNEHGGFAENFLRANDRAEFTKGHDHHGDTEYRYDYDTSADVLKVRHRNLASDDKFNRWKVVFVGALATFLNEYHVTFGSEHAHSDRGLWLTHSGRTQHLAQISLWAQARVEGIADYRARFSNGGWSGNAGSMVTDLCRLGGELLQRLGLYETVLALATDYYDTSLVTMGHPAEREKSSYWREYLGGLLVLASATVAA